MKKIRHEMDNSVEILVIAAARIRVIVPVYRSKLNSLSGFDRVHRLTREL